MTSLNNSLSVYAKVYGNAILDNGISLNCKNFGDERATSALKQTVGILDIMAAVGGLPLGRRSVDSRLRVGSTRRFAGCRSAWRISRTALLWHVGSIFGVSGSGSPGPLWGEPRPVELALAEFLHHIAARIRR